MSELKSVDVWIDDLTIPPIHLDTVLSRRTAVLSVDANTMPIVSNVMVPIQGKMITAKLEIDAHTAVTMDDVALKNKVLNMLINELLAAKCVEFTKQQDVVSNTMVIRARIFATPDDEVRLIRKETNLG